MTRIERLQLWCDQAHTALERMQGNTGLDAGADDAATTCGTQVTVEELDETGFATAVCAVHEPAVPCPHIERDITQHWGALAPYARMPQRYQCRIDAPGPNRRAVIGTAEVNRRRRGCELAPACRKPTLRDDSAALEPAKMSRERRH